MISKKWAGVIKCTIIFSILIIASRPCLASSDASEFSKIIRAIDIKGLSRISNEEILSLLTPEIGSPLNMKNLGAGIKRAFKKGIFKDISVMTEPYGEGLKIIYIIKEVPFVNKIAVEGNIQLSVRQIRKIILYKEGEDFREEYLERAKLEVIDFYKRKGYPDSRVEIVARKSEKPSRIDLHIKIDEGAPLIIERIEIPSDSRHMITFNPGDVFDSDRMNKMLEKMRDHYKKENYIRPVIGPYSFQSRTLSVPLQPGPKLEVVFKNNIAISKKNLSKEVTFLDNREVSDELAAEIADRIRRQYRSKGYDKAQVAAEIEEKNGTIRVTFIVFEGPQTRLRNIRFKGISIDPEVIKKVIPLVENSPFDDSLISSSREAMSRFYNALGYLNMDVVDVNKEFHDNTSYVSLELTIREGPQTKIETIDISGNQKLDNEMIIKAIQLKKRAPYNLIDIGDARYRVLSLYSQYGYVNANVDVKKVIKDNAAFLSFAITENKQSVIGKIIIRGNNMTKAKIISREISFQEGEPYNREEITKTKQHLYKLALFNEVSIELMEPGIKDDGRVVKDILISVKEGNAGSVEVSAGYGDYEEFRGALNAAYRNLGGYHREMGFRAEFSSVEQRYVLNFKEPWLFNWPNVPLKIFLIREDTRSINIETRDVLYNIDKLSFIAGIEKEITRQFKVGLNYEYSFTDTKDVAPGVILSREDTGTLGIGSVSPSLFYDRRDDPIDPRSGSVHGIVLKFASKAFLSETEFVKGSFQSSWFFELYKGLVMACSFRGGAAYGFEETEELPLIERYFLGGRSTVRGYSHDSLGPKGANNNPTGGNVFAMVNAEFRVPLGKGFGLVPFVDAGNVWKTTDEINARLKYTVGAGMRYKTPVGPVRLDYGHKLNKEEGESSGEVHFSFGHAF